jgi:hypothetical protein
VGWGSEDDDTARHSSDRNGKEVVRPGVTRRRKARIVMINSRFRPLVTPTVNHWPETRWITAIFYQTVSWRFLVTVGGNISEDLKEISYYLG